MTNGFCAQCKKQIKEKHFLTCFQCHHTYDLQCTNKEKLYYLMDKEKRAKWTCLKCTRNVGKKITNKRIGTPMSQEGKAVVSPKPLITKTINSKLEDNSKTSQSDNIQKTTPTTPGKTKSMSSSPSENITLSCKNAVINIPTNNTFDSLQTDSEECEDLDITNEITNDTLHKMNRSCPEIIIKSHLDYEALLTKLENLQEKYNSAEYQIELLLAENFSMKKKINEYKSKLCNLTSICQDIENSPRPKDKPTSSTKKSKRKTSSRLSFHQGSDTEQSTNVLSSSSANITEDIQILNSEKTLKEQNTPTQPPLKKFHILSSNTKNKVLKLAKKTFQDEFQICHYLTPHKGILDMMGTLNEKLKTFTIDDYCVIMMGEKDFETSLNYHKLVKNIREKLIDVRNTNIVICLPTFKCGKYCDLYNRRIETFNRQLYFDVQNYENVYLLDSNLHLSYDYRMFSGPQGTINNQGIKIVMNDLQSLVMTIQSYNNVFMDHDIQSVNFAIPTETTFFRFYSAESRI